MKTPFQDSRLAKDNLKLYLETPESQLTKNVNPYVQQQIIIAKRNAAGMQTPPDSRQFPRSVSPSFLYPPATSRNTSTSSIQLPKLLLSGSTTERRFNLKLDLHRLTDSSSPPLIHSPSPNSSRILIEEEEEHRDQSQIVKQQQDGPKHIQSGFSTNYTNKWLSSRSSSPMMIQNQVQQPEAQEQATATRDAFIKRKYSNLMKNTYCLRNQMRLSGTYRETDNQLIEPQKETNIIKQASSSLGVFLAKKQDNFSQLLTVVRPKGTAPSTANNKKKIYSKYDFILQKMIEGDERDHLNDKPRNQTSEKPQSQGNENSYLNLFGVTSKSIFTKTQLLQNQQLLRKTDYPIRVENPIVQNEKQEPKEKQQIQNGINLAISTGTATLQSPRNQFKLSQLIQSDLKQNNEEIYRPLLLMDNEEKKKLFRNNTNLLRILQEYEELKKGSRKEISMSLTSINKVFKKKQEKKQIETPKGEFRLEVVGKHQPGRQQSSVPDFLGIFYANKLNMILEEKKHLDEIKKKEKKKSQKKHIAQKNVNSFKEQNLQTAEMQEEEEQEVIHDQDMNETFEEEQMRLMREKEEEDKINKLKEEFELMNLKLLQSKQTNVPEQKVFSQLSKQSSFHFQQPPLASQFQSQKFQQSQFQQQQQQELQKQQSYSVQQSPDQQSPLHQQQQLQQYEQQKEQRQQQKKTQQQQFQKESEQEQNDIEKVISRQKFKKINQDDVQQKKQQNQSPQKQSIMPKWARIGEDNQEKLEEEKEKGQGENIPEEELDNELSDDIHNVINIDQSSSPKQNIQNKETISYLQKASIQTDSINTDQILIPPPPPPPESEDNEQEFLQNKQAVNSQQIDKLPSFVNTNDVLKMNVLNDANVHQTSSLRNEPNNIIPTNDNIIQVKNRLELPNNKQDELKVSQKFGQQQELLQTSLLKLQPQQNSYLLPQKQENQMKSNYTIQINSPTITETDMIFNMNPLNPSDNNPNFVNNSLNSQQSQTYQLNILTSPQQEEPIEEKEEEIGFVLKRSIDFDQLRVLRDKTINRLNLSHRNSINPPSSPSLPQTQSQTSQKEQGKQDKNNIQANNPNQRNSLAQNTNSKTIQLKAPIKKTGKKGSKGKDDQINKNLNQDQPEVPVPTLTEEEKIKEERKEKDLQIAMKLEDAKDKVKAGVKSVIKEQIAKKMMFAFTDGLNPSSNRDIEKIDSQTNLNSNKQQQVAEYSQAVMDLFSACIDDLKETTTSAPINKNNQSNQAFKDNHEFEFKGFKNFDPVMSANLGKAFESELKKQDLSEEELERFRYIYEINTKVNILYSGMVKMLGGVDKVRQLVLTAINRVAVHLPLLPIGYTWSYEILHRRIIPGICALLTEDQPLFLKNLTQFQKSNREFSFIDFYFVKREVFLLLTSKNTRQEISLELSLGVMQKLESVRRYIFPVKILADDNIRDKIVESLMGNTQFIELFKENQLTPEFLKNIIDKLFDYFYSNEETETAPKPPLIRAMCQHLLVDKLNRKLLDYIQVNTLKILQSQRYTLNLILRDLHYKFTKVRLRLGFNFDEISALIEQLQLEVEAAIQHGAADYLSQTDKSKLSDLSFIEQYLKFVLAEHDIYSVFDFAVAMPYEGVSFIHFQFWMNSLRAVLLTKYNLQHRQTNSLVRFLVSCCPSQ